LQHVQVLGACSGKWIPVAEKNMRYSTNLEPYRSTRSDIALAPRAAVTD
jgi:hypothetical protein